jgi:hypothetical protein
MADILGSLTSMLKPELIGAMGKTFGVDTSAVQKAIGAAGPLLLGGMTKNAAKPGGADALLKMLPSGGDGMLGSLGNIGSMLGGLMGAGSSGGMLSSILGSGSNAVGASISKAVGFNVTPVLSMLAPAIMGIVGKAAKSANLDGAGLANLLTKEHTEFAGNPANAGAMSLVNAAMEAGDTASAMITQFGPDWEKVSVGPAAVLYMIAAADPSGPVGSVKEAKAANEALLAAANAAAPTSLLAAAFTGGITKEALTSLKTLAPNKEALLTAVNASVAAVKAHAPAESKAFNDALFAVATAAANASKEGGFLGIGGTLVSKEEQAALDTLKAAFA